MRGKNNQILISSETNIGSASAEHDDQFLFKCFQDHPMIAAISEVDNSKSFLAGRTGEGKTAALKMLVRNNERTASEVDLLDMALDYVSNSDILRFVSELGVDLSLFFQTLWKHVLVIEYIRLKYNIDSDQKSTTWYRTFTDFFSNDPRQEKALDYLTKWGAKFWITMDESIKQVTENYERSLIAELGTAFEKFKSKIGFTRNLSTEKRAEYTHRARKVLDGNQLADLSKVLSALKQYNSSARSRSFFVVIDRIDERWVDESIRFQLIRALFDAVKPFGKIRDLKIIVSMRVDVLERVIFETRDLGFQRDKFEDQSYRIKWTKERLKSLVDKRINYLCQWQYTTENVHFDHIFKHNVSSKTPFEYMLERSFLRPRDLINFANLCLNEADGRHEVTANHVKAAERRYSSTMIDGIISEWASILPSLKILLPKISGNFSLVELSTLVDHEFLVDFYVSVEAANLPFEDNLTKAAQQFFDDDSSSNYRTAAATIAAELYRTGILGLKLQANDRYRFSYKDEPRINAESIDLRTRCQIHNALHIALNITPANRQPRVRSLAN